MTIKTVVLSSAHGKFVRGAKGCLDEVEESRKLMARIAQYLGQNGITVTTINDDVSHTVGANLRFLVNAHNSRKRDLDCSIHFNAHHKTTKPMGCEVLYRSDNALPLARKVSAAIANASGLKDRGPKHRTKLAVLNGTTARWRIMLEVAFVDSEVDCKLYRTHSDAIAKAVAEALI